MNVAVRDDDADLRDVNPTFPKIAAGFTLLSGMVAILNTVQTITSVRIFGSVWPVVPFVLGAFGLFLMYLATKVFTARRWAAFTVLVAGSLLTLVAMAWLFFAVKNGFIALYAIWTPLFALVAVGLCAGALPACERATRARASLASQGLSIGL